MAGLGQTGLPFMGAEREPGILGSEATEAQPPTSISESLAVGRCEVPSVPHLSLYSSAEELNSKEIAEAFQV